MEKLDQYVERLQKAVNITMRKMGNELTDSKEIGLTGPQFYILNILSNGHGFTVSELAEKLNVKPSAITVMIDRLLKSGFVKRERDGNDRRVVLVELSEEGLEMLNCVKEKRTNIIKRYLACLDESELEALVKIYEKVATNSK